jgi:hypothetical protein
MKYTWTDTSDFGWVVVVVGRCGSNRFEGTFEAGIELGSFCVGMEHPVATPASARSNAAASSRLTW